ncbi:AAA family ATPase [Pseudomonas sp. P5_C3]
MIDILKIKISARTSDMFKFLANKSLPEMPLLVDFTFDKKILVVTGVNGVGKTRTLKGVAGGGIVFAKNNNVVETKDMVSLASESMRPQFEGGFDEGNYQTGLTQTLAYFKQNRDLFSVEFNAANNNAHYNVRGGHVRGLNYAELHSLCAFISREFKKPLAKITEEDVRLNFKGSTQVFAGVNAFAATCNIYIKQTHNSLFNQWRNEKFGADLAFVAQEDIVSFFGEAPWELMNRVLDASLGGKFRFQTPDVNSFSYDYSAVLEEVRTGRPVVAIDLSAGEQTLMWMALVMFNMLYSKNSGQLPPTLLLLDEPDVFLHPKMAKNLYTVLEAVVKNFDTVVVLTTHSPTTVALAPDDAALAIMSEGALKDVDKDYAITQLLEGINHISISPENRRQVFVESTYDCSIYTEVYNRLNAISGLDSGVSLSFVSSGPAYPRKALEEKVRQYFNPKDLSLQDFLTAMRGDGDCSQVIGMVERLTLEGSKTVRGVTDWDKKNKGNEHVKVFASDYAYTMENVAIDPIAVMLFLHNKEPKTYPISKFCQNNVHYSVWLKNQELLQSSVDWFLKELFDYDNAKDVDVTYVGMPLVIRSDKRYLLQDGHGIARELFSRYNEFGAIARNENALGSKLVENFLHHTNGEFISVEFQKLFKALQS